MGISLIHSCASSIFRASFFRQVSGYTPKGNEVHTPDPDGRGTVSEPRICRGNATRVQPRTSKSCDAARDGAITGL